MGQHCIPKCYCVTSMVNCKLWKTFSDSNRLYGTVCNFTSIEKSHQINLTLRWQHPPTHSKCICSVLWVAERWSRGLLPRWRLCAAWETKAAFRHAPQPWTFVDFTQRSASCECKCPNQMNRTLNRLYTAWSPEQSLRYVRLSRRTNRSRAEAWKHRLWPHQY